MKNDATWVFQSVTRAKKAGYECKVEQLTELFVGITELEGTHPKVHARLVKLVDSDQFDQAMEELKRMNLRAAS